jgi:hypothetical protein
VDERHGGVDLLSFVRRAAGSRMKFNERSTGLMIIRATALVVGFSLSN